MNKQEKINEILESCCMKTNSVIERKCFLCGNVIKENDICYSDLDEEYGPHTYFCEDCYKEATGEE